MKALPQVSTTKPKRAPKLREARLEDYEQIAALESRFGLTAKPYNEWVHLWQGNPLYRELKTDWPIGWVVEDQDGKIVGSMGNIPFLYELDGRRILVASGHSWVADLEYRSVSLLLLHKLIRQSHVDLYLNNTVGNSSVAAVTALGCSRMPVGIWDEARPAEKSSADSMMRYIIAVVSPADSSDSRSPCQRMPPRHTASTSVANAPMPAASVAENQPR